MEGSCCKEHSNERSSLWRALPLSNSIALSALMAFYLISTGRGPLHWRLLRTALPASHLFLAPGVFCPDFSLREEEGWVEKARLFRISMTMACRAVAGVGARKILVSTQEGPSMHGQNTISFFVDIRPTTSHNGCDYHHWLSPLFLLFCRGYMARGKVWRRLGCLVGEVESREAMNQARSHKYK